MPLQKQFRGLLDHIGQYSLGNLKFAPSPVIDIGVSAEDFITPPEYVTASGTLTAAGQVGILPSPPEGEFWRYRWIGWRSIDTTVTTLVIPVFTADGARFFGLQYSNTASGQQVSANSFNNQGMQFEGREGFIVRPGQTLGFKMERVGLGTVSSDFTVIGFRQIIKF